MMSYKTGNLLKLYALSNMRALLLVIIVSAISGSAMLYCIMRFTDSETYANAASFLMMILSVYMLLMLTYLNVATKYRYFLQYGATRRNALIAFFLTGIFNIAITICTVSVLSALEASVNRTLYEPMATLEQISYIGSSFLPVLVILSVLSLLLGFIAGVATLRFGTRVAVILYFAIFMLPTCLLAAGEALKISVTVLSYMLTGVTLLSLGGAYLSARKLLRLDISY
jgi:hypothetical protein